MSIISFGIFFYVIMVYSQNEENRKFLFGESKKNFEFKQAHEVK